MGVNNKPFIKKQGRCILNDLWEIYLIYVFLQRDCLFCFGYNYYL
jgi:hypothetical protein